MSANMMEERPLFMLTWPEPEPKVAKPKRASVSSTVSGQRERVEPVQQATSPQVTADDEARMVTIAVICMAFFAITPLILFFIVTFFFPDIFMVPLAP